MKSEASKNWKHARDPDPKAVLGNKMNYFISLVCFPLILQLIWLQINLVPY